MRVEGVGLTNGKVERMARDLDLRVEWLGKTPRRGLGNFRIVPTGERWAIAGSREACLHAYNQFIYRLFRSGARRVQTVIRDYRTVEALEDPYEPEFAALRREVEARYGRQECSCR